MKRKIENVFIPKHITRRKTEDFYTQYHKKRVNKYIYENYSDVKKQSKEFGNIEIENLGFKEAFFLDILSKRFNCCYASSCITYKPDNYIIITKYFYKVEYRDIYILKSLELHHIVLKEIMEPI